MPFFDGKRDILRIYLRKTYSSALMGILHYSKVLIPHFYGGRVEEENGKGGKKMRYCLSLCGAGMIV